MNYEIEPPAEGMLHVVTWYGPFCRAFSRDSGEARFALSEEGLAALRTWLMEQAAEMEANPPYTQEECRAWYESRRRSGG